MAGLDESEVVDPGGHRWWLGVLRDPGMAVTTGDVRHRLTHRSALEADLDGFQMERVEDELDSPTDERGIDLIGVAEQVDGAGLCDHAPLGPQEGLVKLFGRRRRTGCSAGEEALDRRLAGLGVPAAVIDGLDEGGEQRVHLVEAADLAGIELDQELLPHGLEDALDLPTAFRSTRLAVMELHPEHRARPQQLDRDHCAPVIEVDGLGDPTSLDARAECGLEAERVLGVSPAIADKSSGVVVDEGEQIGLPAPDDRPVQGVAGPQLVRAVRLEAPEGEFRPALGPGEADTDEVALQGALVRCPAPDGPQQLADVRRGALWALAPQSAGEVQQLLGRAGVGMARLGLQCREAAGAEHPRPAVDRGA